MSIFGNPVMMGGSGGGGENAYVSFDAPTSAVGENGQYWFELAKRLYALNSEATRTASSAICGWEFTANESVVVVGARAKTNRDYAANILFGTPDGTVIVTQPINVIAGEWVTVFFDNPITLSAGQNYIVMFSGSSSTQSYSSSMPSLKTTAISYVRGRYGLFPGTQEPNSFYNVDIALQQQPPFPVKTQYYKTGGVWVAV